MVGLVGHFVLLIFPFLIRAVMIKKLGVDYLGIGSLFSSILGVLSLAELGFGSAAVYFLYEPVAKKDYETINSLLLFYRTIFRIIGGVILGVGLILLPFLENLIHGDYPSDINIYVIYLMHLASTVVGYFFFSYKSVIITANQRDDIESIVTTGMNALMYLIQLAVLILFSSYYTYAVLMPLLGIATNIVRSVVVDKMFPGYRCAGKISSDLKRDIYKRISALFGHKLNMKVIQTVDSVVISSFLGLGILGIYGNYFYILSALAGITAIITNSIRPIVGKSMVCENEKVNLRTLNHFLFIFSWIIGFCCTSLVCLYQNFMVIWVGEDYLLGISSVILFAVYFWIWKIGDIFMLYRDAGGLWLKVKYYPYVSAVLNLVVNIVLVSFIGINGVILSTVLTLGMISIPCEIRSIFKNYFKTGAKQTIRKTLYYTLLVSVNTLITYAICYLLVPGNTLVTFLIRSVICGVVPNAIYFLLFRKTAEFAYFKNYILGKFKSGRQRKKDALQD